MAFDEAVPEVVITSLQQRHRVIALQGPLSFFNVR